MTAPTHPRHRLDEVIHAPVRLSVMAALTEADRVEFRFLRDVLGVSDSLLSKHVLTLETAGYVNITKGYAGRRPRTWLSRTATGEQAYQTYLAALNEILGTNGRS